MKRLIKKIKIEYTIELLTGLHIAKRMLKLEE